MGNYFSNVWAGIGTALIGMKITWKHLIGHKVTRQYPEKYHPSRDGGMPEFARNRLFSDMELCIGCLICQRNCPVNCISIETIKASKDDPEAFKKSGDRVTLWVNKFDINISQCMFCNLCTEECPTDAIYMTHEFEYTKYNRDELIYHFSVMTPEQIEAKKKIAEEEKAKKAAEAAAKAAAAKAAEAKASEAKPAEDKPAE
jgi:NADH-quinone oxidoreductase subunit I